MRLFLIRHAESYSNTQGRMMSSTDLDLTEKGLAQARAAGAALFSQLAGRRFDAAFSSTRLRARRTAEMILSAWQGESPPVRALACLREMELGQLEGLTWEERAERFPDIETDRGLSALRAPGGESYEDLLRRCAEFCGELAALPENARVLTVSHGITLRALVNFLLMRPDGDVNFLNWPENTAITELEWLPGKPGRLLRLFDDSHLRETGLASPDYEEWGLFAERDYLSLRQQPDENL